jgi:hypothetical protein
VNDAGGSLEKRLARRSTAATPLRASLPVAGSTAARLSRTLPPSLSVLSLWPRRRRIPLPTRPPPAAPAIALLLPPTPVAVPVAVAVTAVRYKATHDAGG